MIYIALLRGINVGGHNKVPMAELREVLSSSGLKNVQTYIQSGNVVFETSKTQQVAQEQVKKIIKTHFGFEVPVIVKTNSELQVVFDACPFDGEKKLKSYFILFDQEPTALAIKEAQEINLDNEEPIVTKNALYFYTPLGMGKSKFNMKTFERKLNLTGTSRNYNTMLKLLSLSQ